MPTLPYLATLLTFHLFPRATTHYHPSPPQAVVSSTEMKSSLKSQLFGSKRNRTSSQNPTSPNGSLSAASPTPPPNSSQTSLPVPGTGMNPNQLGRPPSYSYNTTTGRPQSPMPPHPPPIDTRGYTGANPPMGPPQPPGYGGAGYGAPQPGMQPSMGQYGAGRPAEVEGAGRSKAQLIVGIDFVRCLDTTKCSACSPRLGNDLLRRRIRFRNKHRSKRRYYNRMARCRESDETKGKIQVSQMK